MTGLNVLKTVGSRSMSIRVLQNVRRRQRTVARVTKANETVRSNRRLAVREIAEDRNISVGPCHETLVEKNLKCTASQQHSSLGRRSEKQSRHRPSRIVRPRKRWRNVHEANYYGWRDPAGLRLWCRDKSPIITVGRQIFVNISRLKARVHTSVTKRRTCNA